MECSLDIDNKLRILQPGLGSSILMAKFSSEMCLRMSLYGMSVISSEITATIHQLVTFSIKKSIFQNDPISSDH